jgi:hypothetical protein
MKSDISKVSIPAARIALNASGLTVLLLVLLHFLSPEFDPSWRMVSEYANGDYSWVLTLLFASWAISSWALAYVLKSQVKTKASKVGLVALVVAGFGEAMAAAFDINHTLHDMAGNIGILSFVVAAVLLSRSLGRTEPWARFKESLQRLTHLTWISVLLLIVSFVVLMSTYISSGGDPNAAGTITELPNGVIAFVGWTNRLLVVAYCLWVSFVAWKALVLRSKK